MIMAIKVLVMLAIVLLLCYPFIPMKGKMRRYSVASSLQYQSPHNRKNVFFVLLIVIEFILVAVLFKLFEGLAQTIYAIPFIGGLFSKAVSAIGSQADYIIFAIMAILINLIVLYVFIFIKAFLKKAVINPICGIGKEKKVKLPFWKRKKKKKKKKKKGDETPEEEETPEEDPEPTKEELEEERKRKRRRIPDFIHRITEDDEPETEGEDGKTDGKEGEKKDEKPEKKPEKKPYGKFASKILSVFFEGEEFQYARNWVIRTRTVLQLFIRLVQALYALFLVLILLSVFFDMPKVMYDILINILRIREWYIYPLISLIFLQEICNVFDTDTPEAKTPEAVREEEEKKEAQRRDAKVRALLAELKKRFDAEHYLRCYPEIIPDEIPEYNCTNVMYASALNYIKNQMRESSGKVVQSYMEFLDAVYGESHAYFSASFYSELGEYLIAYTYIRLLSGARLIYVVSDESEKDTLRKYISDRLMRLTGSNAAAGWRVYTADERLDQADVLIACPEDFLNTDIIDRYPGFFEEACNAVFIDADRTISLYSYICSIIATRLQNATDGHIRFIFLTLDLFKGFAAGSLPKFFCVDQVLSFSSARENEAVSYVLWNKESKKHRIYNKSGQKLTCLEAIIAEQACEHDIDGVRLITESPIEHAQRMILSMHDVEINNLYKNIVDVNYMIYSDDSCNLSAALYACTRFRGRKKSVVHILSKPYLLREYFMSKAITEDYINRSSFIQPRVTEHAERHKLSLVRIFCDAGFDKGMPVSEFEKRMREVITTALDRSDIISSAFCCNLLKNRDVADLKLNELAAYLVAGLHDNDLCVTDEEKAESARNSAGHRAKDFYIVVEPSAMNGYTFMKEKYIIFNRVKEVLGRLLECNKRVELRLNDKTIGLLDTFPIRTHLEYIEGQNIIYNNCEYEIERIAADGSAIYLRHENINIRNCLDTVLLRRYDMKSMEPLEKSAVLDHSKAMLREIRVTRCRAAFDAETYGFYSLTGDRQTLDFYQGVEGSPRSEYPHTRRYNDARVLHVSLSLRRECNDGMRLLMAAVFNEFIRTIFPNAYHCIAICPVLEQPLSLDAVYEVNTEDKGEAEKLELLARIKTLYPFLEHAKKEQGEQENAEAQEAQDPFKETDPMRMQFLFINDCYEDVGVLDWFYDRAARYMQEFLANVYSYLHWLRLRPEKNHYIYFGGEALPECYDLEGCCEILGDLNLILSDDGKKDIETAGDDMSDEKVEYCSFCHKPAESGRFMFFDKHRFICSECEDIVYQESRLRELYDRIKGYLEKKYPEIVFGAATVKFDPVYDLQADQALSEFNSRLDFSTKTIYVEMENPVNNALVSILRGVIAFWQVDNGLSNEYASAQLYYEEIAYLRSLGEDIGADWVYNNVPADVRTRIDEIMTYTASDAEQNENKTEHHTSFSFMRVKADEINRKPKPNEEEEEGEEYSDDLFDPNKIPRLWKRFLRNKHLDDGEEEIPEVEDPEDPEDPDDPDDPDDPKDPKDPEGPEEPEEVIPVAVVPAVDPVEEDIPEVKPVDEEIVPEEEEIPEVKPVDEEIIPEEEEIPEHEPIDEEIVPEEEETPEDEPIDEETIPEEEETPEVKPVDEEIISKENVIPAEDNDEEEPMKFVSDDDIFDNAPPISGRETDTPVGGEPKVAADPKAEKKRLKQEEKQRKKEEKKRKKEEKRRLEELEWERIRADVKRQKEEKRAKLGLPPKKTKGKNEPATATEGGGDVPKKEKKKWSLFGRKKNKAEDPVKTDIPTPDAPEEDPTKKDVPAPVDPVVDPTKPDPSVPADPEFPEEPEEDPAEVPSKVEKGNQKGKKKEKPGKKEKKPNKKGKGGGLFKRRSRGEKIRPYEEDEENNPSIRLYNDLVRGAYDYSEGPFSRVGVTDEELGIILRYVRHDYPELFWLSGNYSWTAEEMWVKFRCKDANGRLDVKQIEQKCKELRKAATQFTKGITKKTDPYKALLTIYRRVILTLDYDGVGLNAHIDQDETRDDALRSLYNALVMHKVVCAGYAVAMQYLLQSIGIVCGYVSSEAAGDGGTHAFNILKIGKYCYYLDATWGDSSNTLHNNHKNEVSYDYFCVPYEEFIRTPDGQQPLHMPRREFYPKLETFHYTNHEYYRYHKAYLKSYDESEIARIIAETALRYDEKEMGDFRVGIRCATPATMKHVVEMLCAKGRIAAVLEMAVKGLSSGNMDSKKARAKDIKKAEALLERKFRHITSDANTAIMNLVFEVPEEDKKKKKKAD